MDVKSLMVGDMLTVIGRVDSVVHEPVPKGVVLKFLEDMDTVNCVLPAKFEGKLPNYRYRYLFKSPCAPSEVMYLGWTLKYLGHVTRTTTSHSYEYGTEVEPGGINIDARILVLMCMSIGKAQRYGVPFGVLPEQVTGHVKR